MDCCEVCGFVYEEHPTSQVGDLVRSLAGRYECALLAAETASAVRTRPAPQVWSALEYACHVRDVLLVQRDRLLLALVEERPSYPRMYRDERVVLAGYQRESVEDVVRELSVAANLMAKVVDPLSPEQLQREFLYNFPEPATHDIAWLARHTAHEVYHHLGDVRSVLAQLSS